MTECERPTPYDERPDLDLVAAYLEAHGLSVERFSKEETLSGKTPDFRARKGGAIVAYCEVKAPQDDPWLDDLLRCAPPDTTVGYARSAPTFKRLARHLKKAALQLAAVNPNRTELNILAYVNHEDATRYADFHELLTGRFIDTNGKQLQTRRPPAKVHEIDVYLWFEGATTKPSPIVNDADPKRMRRVCALLDFPRLARSSDILVATATIGTPALHETPLDLVAVAAFWLAPSIVLFFLLRKEARETRAKLNAAGEPTAEQF